MRIDSTSSALSRSASACSHTPPKTSPGGPGRRAASRRLPSVVTVRPTMHGGPRRVSARWTARHPTVLRSASMWRNGPSNMRREHVSDRESRVSEHVACSRAGSTKSPHYDRSMVSQSPFIEVAVATVSAVRRSLPAAAPSATVLPGFAIPSCAESL